MFIQKYKLQEEIDDGTGQGAGDGGGEPFAWFWNEGAQGEGEPPEWFKADKYKTVADQAAAYPEIEKRLGGFTGAPEEYSLALPESYELPEGIESQLDADDPLAQAFVAWGKENNVSQDAFSQILAMYTDAQIRDYQAMEQTTQAEIEKLGPNADARIDAVVKWGRATLDDEQFEMLKVITQTAEGVQMAEIFRDMTRNQSLPDPQNLNPNLMASKQMELKELEQAKTEDGRLKWFTDPVHQAKIDSLRREIYGEGEHREVVKW